MEPLVEYSMHGRVVCSNDTEEVERWWSSFASCTTLSFDGEFLWNSDLQANVMALAQFTGGVGSSAATTLLTNLVSHPRLLQRILSPETILVGKDLRGDWDALHAAVRLSGVECVELLDGETYQVDELFEAGSTAAGWRDITQLLPLHRIDASTESIARLFLGQTASWKRTVDHADPPSWDALDTLSQTAKHYAACDACFVWDVMTTVKRQVEAHGGCLPWH